MPESLRDAIEDIQKKLKVNAYQNEEHVRLSLVARVVQALGWDIWNPGEVNTETYSSEDENSNSMNSLILMTTGELNVPVFIRCQADFGFDTIKLDSTFPKAEKVNDAQIMALTNGSKWLFYLKSDLEYSKNEFDKIDLLKEDKFTTSKLLECYLSKSDLQDGTALKSAKLKRERQIHTELEKAFNEAFELIYEEPWPDLPTALCEITRKRGLEISRVQAIDFLRKSYHEVVVTDSRLLHNELFPPEKVDKIRTKYLSGEVKMKGLYETINRVERIPAYQEAQNTIQHEPFASFPNEVMKLLSRDGIHLDIEQVVAGIQRWREEKLARLKKEE